MYQNNNQGIFNNNPNSNTTDNSQKVYKLQGNASAPATGLDITLKVMSGDKIDILGKSYWKDKNTTQGNSNLVLQNVVQGLLATPGGLAASKGATATGLTTGANPLSLPAPFLTRNPAAGDEKPMAYINYILLDEQFGYVNSGFVRVGLQNQVTDHFIQGIAVTKNGYLYVYCSNQSPVDVFFDNLQLVQTRSPLIEETHYYPFGLSMSGISSKALSFGEPGNKNKFNSGNELQSNEFSDGSGLELYDAIHRMYDPQLGRFNQIDPLADVLNSISPFAFASNNPILRNDPFGLKDTVYRNPNYLPTVTVTTKAQSRNNGGSWLGYPAYSKAEQNTDRGYQNIYYQRKINNQPITNINDPSDYLGHARLYKKWDIEEKNSRAMQAWAVGIIAAPVALSTVSPSVLIASLRIKLQTNIGAGLVDIGVQSLSNGIQGKSIIRDYNIVSTVAAVGIGAPTTSLSNVAGVSLINATLSTSINVSANSLDGSQPFISFSPTSILVNAAFGTIGGINANEAGILSGSQAFGEVTSFPIIFAGSLVDNKLSSP